jgi:arginase
VFGLWSEKAYWSLIFSKPPTCPIETFPLSPYHLRHALVAQLDRASDFESEGRRFEPCRVHQFFIEPINCISTPLLSKDQNMSQAPGDAQLQPQLALVGFRYDENSSFMKGAAEGPSQIRAALRSEAWHLTSEDGTDLSGESMFFDAGDIEPVTGSDMFSLIENSTSTLLNDGVMPICLGGDHSITYPIIRAFARKYKPLNILHFDAHPDIYDNFQGNRHSHASPFARIMEEKLVTRLVQVGIRTFNAHQREQVKKFNVESIEMRDLRDGLVLEFDQPLYISFDVDALDPAFAPGVSHREPGGLSTRQAIDLIQRLKGKVIGADIVEFNPRMDPLHITGTVCAKLLKEIAARMLAG